MDVKKALLYVQREIENYKAYLWHRNPNRGDRCFFMCKPMQGKYAAEMAYGLRGDLFDFRVIERTIYKKEL